VGPPVHAILCRDIHIKLKILATQQSPSGNAWASLAEADKTKEDLGELIEHLQDGGARTREHLSSSTE
jgi:hypothetical protein